MKWLLFVVLQIGKYSPTLHMCQKDLWDWSHAELHSLTLFTYLGGQLLQQHLIVATWVPSVTKEEDDPVQCITETEDLHDLLRPAPVKVMFRNYCSKQRKYYYFAYSKNCVKCSKWQLTICKKNLSLYFVYIPIVARSDLAKHQIL